MFQIETSQNFYAQLPKPKELDGRVEWHRDSTYAERWHRQRIEEIQACETVKEVNGLLAYYDELLDRLWLDFPDYADAIKEAADDQKIFVTPVTKSRALEDTHSKNQRSKGSKMFSIDTNTGGESGPFLNYKNRAGQGMPDGSWFLRAKDGDQWSYTDMTNTFKQGFIADVFATHDGQLGGTLKMGFIKFQEGTAPERHVWSSPLRAEERRSDEKTPQGGYAWQNMVNFRMAIGGGESALFDVSGWSGYKGVMALIDQMNRGFAANLGKCPLVQYTGFRVEGSGTKRLHVPEFVIAKWVDRPACLTPDAPQVSTSDPEPQVPPAAQAPQPAASAAGF